MATDLDTLFREHSLELRRFAYRETRDRDRAADLVQDTFLRYASQPAGSFGIEQPRFFLWRILRNLVIDLRRRERRRGEHVGLDSMADSLADPAPTIDRHLEGRQQLARLQAALNELPANCRSALLMNRLDGMGHAEIASRLKVSTSMVTKYIMRALRHCARRLGLDR
ncbi:MAG: sigma-70 family RNA polymerase sigma factor [Ferrovibrio sp.]|uniref:RNA polymerase sigma factor n=1 Tax=Ferrovibrio sp. TaxID=1917215 RepID=UPI0026188423|nr:sigma-70 family RNA polymerase sigma factor [Ferrovibrio sp.]MCW0233547.1 sigma-70 family RNA polymerase sigma factor [Ferrovibrio sp.]